ncbi:hypothetical protein TNIN_47011 [Trichonephila inaurata madagascariensis]|uniref:Uncharacterized protein n=1 Tax=Trichonephila inaurata madagascariensis TaxID=2747483 RepID=A0A8X6JAZ7_9ARAC|nr:hypothetical protein TNIN_47011 [Trichonephila inaurata madagascariensis]
MLSGIEEETKDKMMQKGAGKDLCTKQNERRQKIRKTETNELTKGVVLGTAPKRDLYGGGEKKEDSFEFSLSAAWNKLALNPSSSIELSFAQNKRSSNLNKHTQKSKHFFVFVCVSWSLPAFSWSLSHKMHLQDSGTFPRLCCFEMEISLRNRNEMNGAGKFYSAAVNNIRFYAIFLGYCTAHSASHLK